MIKRSLTLPLGIMAMSDETKKKIRESRTGPGIPLSENVRKAFERGNLSFKEAEKEENKNRQERMG
jgi:hypothetical protein